MIDRSQAIRLLHTDIRSMRHINIRNITPISKLPAPKLLKLFIYLHKLSQVLRLDKP